MQKSRNITVWKELPTSNCVLYDKLKHFIIRAFCRIIVWALSFFSPAYRRTLETEVSVTDVMTLLNLVS